MPFSQVDHTTAVTVVHERVIPAAVPDGHEVVAAFLEGVGGIPGVVRGIWTIQILQGENVVDHRRGRVTRGRHIVQARVWRVTH